MPLYEWAYHAYFRVKTSGWHHIPAQGNVLFVGSHNGGLAAPDMHMFIYDWFRRFGFARPVYGLMHPKVWQVFPETAQMAAQFGALPATARCAIAALQQQASVLLYPGGVQDAFRPHRLRDRICFAGRTGFIKLALRQRVPIVPLISWGAHDTLIVLEDCYQQVEFLYRQGWPWPFNFDPEVFPIYLGLPWGLSIGPLPQLPFPVQIHTRVCPPIQFKHYGREAARDQEYVNTCYQKTLNQMQTYLNQLIYECQD